MTAENKPVNSVLVPGAGEPGLAVLRAMSDKAREQTDVKICVLLRSEAVHAVSGPRKTRWGYGMM